ncbi:MAG: TonB-dependent receptor [Acidobacteria bacterium]|nr:TonB-dependent receptor [Acidobacteriota bacterium]
MYRSRSAASLLVQWVLVVVSLASFAQAQFRAGIQGVVTDPNDALVPDATVTLTSNETNVRRSTTTSESGVYTISGLAPGAYKLSVEKVGFSKKVLEDVRVSAEQMRSLNVELELGEITESITVSELMIPRIDSQSAIIGGTITAKEFERLPSFGRDPFKLLRLAPGVFGDGAQSAGGGGTSMPGVNRGGAGAADSIFGLENGPQIIANGTRQNSNNIQIDGVGVNSVSWAGSAVVTPNEESIKEIRVISNNYTAENGRNSGAQILVVSQNGTNEYHGSGFFKFHRPGLNAFQRWNGPGIPTPVQRDNNRFNQFGGSVGGPIVKNKLFGFFSYEGLRNGARNSGNAWFETPQYLQSAGPANSLARRMLSFAGQTPISGGAISMTCAQVGLVPTQCRDTANGLDLGSALTTPLGTADPTWGQPGTPFGIGSGFDGIPDVMRIQTLTPSNTVNAQYNVRIDFHPTEKDMIAYSLYRVPTVTHSINGPARDLNRWNSERLSQSWTGIWTRTFSPTLLNEARFGASGWKFDDLESNPQEPWGLPVSNFDSPGSPVNTQQFGPNGPGSFDQGTWNVRDTLSKVHNSHSLKFGADISRAKFLDAAPWSARPTYSFRNLWDYANDAPFRESGNFDPVTGQPTLAEKHLNYSIFGFFAQDDWKVKPNLTLNLGLRWEYYSPMTERDEKISNPTLGSGTAALTGLTIRNGGGLTRTSKKNFGPQVGLAWSPASFFGRELNNKLVLRGGFGIGFNIQQLANLSDQRFNPPFSTQLTLFGSNILYVVPSDVRQFTSWPTNPVARFAFDPTSGLPVSGAPLDLVGFESYQRTPTTYRYSLDAQYDLGHSWVATIGYQGSQTRNYSRQRNLNLIHYPNLNPRVNRLNWYSNDASAHYHALLTGIQHRFSPSFEVDAQYRLSRNTDQGSQDYFADWYPFDIEFSNGPADFDVTHDFKMWGVWTPTIFKGSHSWLEKVAGGWSLSGILNHHSGFPWTPQYCNTGGNVVFPNSGYRCLRPASYSGGAGSDFSNSTFRRPNGNFPNGALAYLTVPTWPATGVPPAPGVGRNVFRGPRYLGFDATLAKSFGLPNMKILGENARFNIQANVFNVFNKLNLTGINTSISNDGRTSNPLFGQAQRAFAGRIIELQARFSF